MTPAARLAALLRADAARWQALRQVAALDLPGGGWIGAGFLRNAAWDALHGRAAPHRGDVDVLWHAPAQATPEADAAAEAALRTLDPALDWSVRNQARMHLRNGDAPYASVAEAMRHWPETATAVAARRQGEACEILAPYGLEDLFALLLRPTPGFADGPKHAIFRQRVADKGWLARWPLLQLA
ncbi:nucleotidyltransferase family protein [Siccirubricoccus phaeus]|uniref:nucleotidyltransferase family protein n=1 Tax=Siccirubricoccus phaeus TaxID=2595053 RepID=UPI0011F3258D|nr:nucleotidyltransferase family protein [Siccirubricoccus phaeus]